MLLGILFFPLLSRCCGIVAKWATIVLRLFSMPTLEMKNRAGFSDHFFLAERKHGPLLFSNE